MPVMVHVRNLNRVHRSKHYQAQDEEKTILHSPRQAQRVMLGIMRLPQAGEENVKGTSQSSPPPAMPIPPKRQREPRQDKAEFPCFFQTSERHKVPPFNCFLLVGF